MGRATYDAIAGYDDFDWPYGEKRTIVVTSRPIEEPLGPLETWTEGVDSLTAYLRGLDDGDVWMMGGGKLQQSFIERGALDTLEIVVVPELVGGGIPLFPPTGFSRSVRLVDAGPLPAGCVRLLYDFQVNGGLSV